jgi:hypothetical protein
MVSMREGALRISPHVYNNGQEVERLLEALQDSLGSSQQSPQAPLADSARFEDYDLLQELGLLTEA